MTKFIRPSLTSWILALFIAAPACVSAQSTGCNGSCPLQRRAQLVSASRYAGEPTNGMAKIIVPFSAKVSVDGELINGPGAVRWYANPATNGTTVRRITVRANWNDPVTGKTQTAIRRINLHPGKTRVTNLCGGSLEQIKQSIIDETNVQRRRFSLTTVSENDRLSASAQKHANRMAQLSRLSHEIDGHGFLHRAEQEGYSFLTGGENIAEGAWTSTHVVSMWMRSPGHRRNLLNGQYTQIGVGTAWSQDGTRYDVQVFGTPAVKTKSCPVEQTCNMEKSE